MDPTHALSDLHARLLGPGAEAERLTALRRLQEARDRLTTQTRLGLPSSKFAELEASLEAVQAGIDILERLSVSPAAPSTRTLIR